MVLVAQVRILVAVAWAVVGAVVDCLAVGWFLQLSLGRNTSPCSAALRRPLHVGWG